MYLASKAHRRSSHLPLTPQLPFSTGMMATYIGQRSFKAMKGDVKVGSGQLLSDPSESRVFDGALELRSLNCRKVERYAWLIKDDPLSSLVVITRLVAT